LTGRGSLRDARFPSKPPSAICAARVLRIHLGRLSWQNVAV
jgi:hypothetical protein